MYQLSSQKINRKSQDNVTLMSHFSQHTPPPPLIPLRAKHVSSSTTSLGLNFQRNVLVGISKFWISAFASSLSLSSAPQIQQIKLLNWLGQMNRFPFVITLMLAHLTIPSPRITKLSTTPILSLPFVWKGYFFGTVSNNRDNFLKCTSLICLFFA